MAIQSSRAVPGSMDEYLSAYRAVISEHGFSTAIKPGRIQVLGWDLEYLSASTIASFIDQFLVRRLNDFIPDNDHPVILDCGANIGLSVLNYKRQFPNAEIIAFEPDPRLTPVLRRNLQNNGAGDVAVVEAAAWARHGSALWKSDGVVSNRLVGRKNADRDSHSVRTVDLADYLKRPIDLLKMDIEGAEYPVILHLGRRLETIKNILIECHLNPNRIGPFAKLLRVLGSTGFEVFLNSMGVWRDLIRQPELGSSRWEQYLLVVGRRGAAPIISTAPSILPFIGAEGELRMRAGGEESAARTAAILEALKASAGIGPGKLAKRILARPFAAENGLCWWAPLSGLEAAADNSENPMRSRVLFFEDEALLGPAHSQHEDIRRLGGGRHSHWDSVIYFSTSDGSDPNTNGRTYFLLHPETA
jgi:FkbM family methyltransferase